MITVSKQALACAQRLHCSAAHDPLNMAEYTTTWWLQGHASMNDNLRLQRLVLQLSEQVDTAVHAHDNPDADSASVDSMAADSASEVHDSIMGTAEAVFKEMSQQVGHHQT